MFKQTKTGRNKEERPKGINYFKHFPSNFLTPYGLAKEAPTSETMSRRLNSGCCEWLNRPRVALSEMAATITSNMDSLQSSCSTFVNEEVFKETMEREEQLMSSLGRLNTLTEDKAGPKDVKNVLKALYDEGSPLNRQMEEMFQVGGAMFATSIQYMVAKHLLSDPSNFAEKLTSSDASAAKFKMEGTVKGLKTYLNSLLVGNESEGACTSSLVRKRSLLDDLESSEDEEEKRKERKKAKKDKKKNKNI